MADVTDGDRKRVVKALRRLAARGRLSDPELNDRIQRAERALTHAGLDGILLDLPPDPGPQPGAAPPPPSSTPPPTPSSEGPWQMPTPTPPSEGPWQMPTPTPPPVRGAERRRPWRPVNVIPIAFVVWALFRVVASLSVLGSDDGDDEPTGRPIPAISLPPLPATTDRVVSFPATTVPSPGPVTLRVGEDAGEIEPGLYANDADADVDCHWERRDPFQTMLTNGSAPHALVEMRGNEELFSQGCGKWHLYVAPPEEVTIFDDGDWLVGRDIAPGRYRSTPPVGLGEGDCTWETAAGFLHELEEVVSSGFPTGPSVVYVVAGERFSSVGCGTWVIDR